MIGRIKLRLSSFFVLILRRFNVPPPLITSQYRPPPDLGGGKGGKGKGGKGKGGKGGPASAPSGLMRDGFETEIAPFLPGGAAFAEGGSRAAPASSAAAAATNVGATPESQPALLASELLAGLGGSSRANAAALGGAFGSTPERPAAGADRAATPPADVGQVAVPPRPPVDFFKAIFEPSSSEDEDEDDEEEEEDQVDEDGKSGGGVGSLEAASEPALSNPAAVPSGAQHTASLRGPLLPLRPVSQPVVTQHAIPTPRVPLPDALPSDALYALLRSSSDGAVSSLGGGRTESSRSAEFCDSSSSSSSSSDTNSDSDSSGGARKRKKKSSSKRKHKQKKKDQKKKKSEKNKKHKKHRTTPR